MNFFDALHTSASGMSAQRLRMNLISSNIANVDTIRTPQGGPYQRKEPIFAAQVENTSFKDMVEARLAGKTSQVKVVGVVNDPRPPLKTYKPDHPDADEKGFVAKPNISIMEEMVNMLSATRSYEANVTAVSATKKMALKALEIGR
jgi:flagellar basal-body rod protein FlgC